MAVLPAPMRASEAAAYDDVGAPILDAVLQGFKAPSSPTGRPARAYAHAAQRGRPRNDAMGLVPRLAAALFVHRVGRAPRVQGEGVVRADLQRADRRPALQASTNHNLRVKPKGTGYEVEGLAAGRVQGAVGAAAAFRLGAAPRCL